MSYYFTNTSTQSSKQLTGDSVVVAANVVDLKRIEEVQKDHILRGRRDVFFWSTLSSYRQVNISARIGRLSELLCSDLSDLGCRPSIDLKSIFSPIL